MDFRETIDRLESLGYRELYVCLKMNLFLSQTFIIEFKFLSTFFNGVC